MKFEFIDVERAHYAVKMLCDVLEVSRSGYYAWRSRPESQRAARDRCLLVHVKASFARSKSRYGSPRVYEDLRADGERVGRKRVARLMQQSGLKARRRKRFVPLTTQSTHGFPRVENVLNRDFSATEPNKAWAGDITYLPTSEGWLYFASLLDLFSRRVVGWNIDKSMHSELATRALVLALGSRDVGPGLIHHSDQGVQYASTQYRQRLADAEVVPSMSRKGNCWDNAVAESFNSTLKFELGEVLDGLHTVAEVTDAVGEYIHFYNHQRRHSTLAYKTPVEYEHTARMGRAA